MAPEILTVIVIIAVIVGVIFAKWYLRHRNMGNITRWEMIIVSAFTILFSLIVLYPVVRGLYTT